MTGTYWDETWNVVIGCDRVSLGCNGCFAIPTGAIRQANPHPAVAAAFAGTVERRNGQLDWTGRVNMLAERLTLPLRWKKPRRIYVTLLGDLFHDQVSAEFIARVFAVMARTPQHTYLLTTKRHARMRSLVRGEDGSGHRLLEATTDEETARALYDAPWPLPNLHLAVSVEDQRTANLRIPALLDTPAAVRWLSVEPLLEYIDLRLALSKWSPGDEQPWEGDRLPTRRILHWVVAGGESENSGHKARPMHPDWVRGIRDQAIAAGIPFYFKQFGEFRPVPVVDRPGMLFGRAYELDGWHSLGVRERGKSGTFRDGEWRPLEVGERGARAGVLLDRDTFAVRMGAKAAGRELDGRTWDMMPGDLYPAVDEVTA